MYRMGQLILSQAIPSDLSWNQFNSPIDEVTIENSFPARVGQVIPWTIRYTGERFIVR